MQNPYEVTTVEPSHVRDQPRLWRSIGWAVFGYFSPRFVIALLSWLYWGSAAMRDNVDRIVRIHQSVTLSSAAALGPSVACMVFFGFAGLRSLSAGQRRSVPWLLLGIVTLVGCAVTGVLLQAIPLPWTWSAEKANVVRASFICVFPITVLAYHWIRASRVPRGDNNK